MNKNVKLIILGICAVVVVAFISISVTTAFMKPIVSGGNLTEVSLSSCAKIKLTSTSKVDLSSSYPMSRNKGLQTTPYKFTVTSYCNTSVGFNLYIAPLNTNTLAYSNIRYILTNSGTKTVVKEGVLASNLDAASDFTTAEITELNTGLKGTYGAILKIHNEPIALQGSSSFDLYLFIDSEVTNSASGTFKAGVAVKAYDIES